MFRAHKVEELIQLVATLDKAALLQRFQDHQAPFPVDFTPDFLNGQPIDRLRHLFVAVCLHSQRTSEFPADQATLA